MGPIAASYRAERSTLPASIVDALASDERVVAAWLAGSLGRGDDDNLSDLDLWIVVDNGAIDEIIESPESFVSSITPAIMEIAAPQNAPSGGAFPLTWVAGEHGPQQIDWYWQPAGLATRPAGTKLLFQRREIPMTRGLPSLPADRLEREIGLWVCESLLMAFIAGKHVARGNQWAITRHLVHIARCVGPSIGLERPAIGIT